MSLQNGIHKLATVDFHVFGMVSYLPIIFHCLAQGSSSFLLISELRESCFGFIIFPLAEWKRTNAYTYLYVGTYRDIQDNIIYILEILSFMSTKPQTYVIYV